MSKRILERYWRGPRDLRVHEVVSGVFEEIQNDIRAGRVFPALRENEIHLYHEGGRLLQIKPQSAHSDQKYVKGWGDGEVSQQGRLSSAQYGEIKKLCRKRNSECLKGPPGANRETWIVSRLFKRFSAWSEKADRTQPKLIDIEVRLRSQNTTMVDLLFLDDDARLTFVEVKRQYDKRVRSQGNPEVVEQIHRYETALEEDQGGVLHAYGEVGSVLSRAFGFGLTPFDAPETVFRRVPILVCRRDGKHGRDTWLRSRLSLSAKGQIDPCYLVVDAGAIDAGAYGDGPRPPWCEDGRWENLNLRMVFEKIRGLQEP